MIRGGAALRPILVAVIAIQLVWFEIAAVAGQAFHQMPGGRAAGALLGAIVFGSALAALSGLGPRTRRLRQVAIVAALLLTARFQLIRVLNGWYGAHIFASLRNRPSETKARLVVTLRELAAAQEQYRLRQRIYAPSADSLHQWVVLPAGTDLRLSRNRDAGWAARMTME